MGKNLLAIFLFAITAMTWASAAQPVNKEQTNTINVDLFLTSSCPHCQKADAFFRDLEEKKPWLVVQRYLINQDKMALKAFHRVLKQQQLDDYSVPAIFFCNTRWVGFTQTEKYSQALLYGLNYCRDQLIKDGRLKPETIHVLNQLANANLLTTYMPANPSTWLFLPVMALVDAFAACSFFGVLALIAFLHLHQERSVKIGLGVLFILVVAITHHFQQAHTLTFYPLLSWLRMPVALLGLGLISYVFIYYSAYGTRGHPGFITPVLVGLTAFAVQSYQQNCTPNLGLVFQEWLNSQHFSSLRTELYSILYQLVYILPLALLVLFLVFGKPRRVSKFQPLLTCAAWSLLLIIGFLLLVFPPGLSSLSLSTAACLLSLLAGWLTLKKLIP